MDQFFFYKISPAEAAVTSLERFSQVNTFGEPGKRVCPLRGFRLSVYRLMWRFAKTLHWLIKKTASPFDNKVRHNANKQGEGAAHTAITTTQQPCGAKNVSLGRPPGEIVTHASVARSRYLMFFLFFGFFKCFRGDLVNRRAVAGPGS